MLLQQILEKEKSLPPVSDEDYPLNLFSPIYLPVYWYSEEQKKVEAERKQTRSNTMLLTYCLNFLDISCCIALPDNRGSQQSCTCNFVLAGLSGYAQNNYPFFLCLSLGQEIVVYHTFYFFEPVLPLFCRTVRSHTVHSPVKNGNSAKIENAIFPDTFQRIAEHLIFPLFGSIRRVENKITDTFILYSFCFILIDYCFLFCYLFSNHVNSCFH